MKIITLMVKKKVKPNNNLLIVFKISFVQVFRLSSISRITYLFFSITYFYDK